MNTHALHQHALVIGKFYPPHKGHIRLIEEAAKAATQVTVLVYGSQYQHITKEDRVQWICEEVSEFPQTNFGRVKVYPVFNEMYEDYDDENVWKAHDHILQSQLRVIRDTHPGLPDVDLIVSSESYGQEMADTYFGGIDSLEVDEARTVVPISGTECRNDLFGNWKYLPESTRAGLIPRIIVVGAESTGTTTLALDLSEHYKGRYVPEYGRQYTEEWLEARKLIEPDETVEDLVWHKSDFDRIARRQTMLENNAAKALAGYPLVVADTDAFATAIWEGRYVAESRSESDGAPWARTINHNYAHTPRRDLYLITNHEGVPFEPDDIRDGEHIRPDMTQWFEDSLSSIGAPWALMTGSRAERLGMAIKLVDRVIAERLDFQ